MQRRVIERVGLVVAGVMCILSAVAARAQALDGFNWVDLRTDQSTVSLVTKALAKEKYTALREIGFVGVPPQETQAAAPVSSGATASPSASSTSPASSPTAAPGSQPTASPLPALTLPVPPDAHLLVITADRPNPIALPQNESFAVYDLNQKSGALTALVSGPGLKLAGWLRMRREGNPELVATYQDCVECQRTTFFTTFYLDGKTKSWGARWLRAKAGAPVYSEGQEANGGQQVYALLDDEAARVMLATWQHFSGRKRRDSDFVYVYRVENYTDREITQPLAGAEARAMESRLCRAQGEVLGIGGGQNSEICKAGTGLPGAAQRRR